MKTKETVRFDMDKKPIRQRTYLKPLTWLLSFPAVWSHHTKINKMNMEGLKPPYLLLCTHMSFVDFKVTTAAVFPHRANYIVAIDGFLINEWLLRNVGCICKRKFTNDLKLIRHIKYALEENKSIVAIYPEARYSLAGTTAILPESLGKMVKLLKVPVVVLNMHGNYLTSPFWNLTERHCPLEADMTQIVSQTEIEGLSSEEINDRISKAFQYDEYKYQKENKIRIDYKDRAKGLHQVLYLCPHCHAEHMMNSDGNEIWCDKCGKRWVMDEFGELKATEGVTEFPHIPDWYEFERDEVRKEIEAGTYHFEDQVRIESLPNAKRFIPLGEGKLTHDEGGFRLEGTDNGQPFILIKEPLSLYSIHIEYNYKNKGDCIDLSTLDDTYYIYPLSKKNVVTKIHFAAEEMYKIAHKQVEELKKKP